MKFVYKLAPYFFYITTIATATCQTNTKEKLYQAKLDSVTIETSNGKIFGLLYQPVGMIKSKTPAILCLQGGGNVGIDNYKYEPKFFASHGIISLICDKSGAGLSKTNKDWRQQSFKEKTTEYLEIFNWLLNFKGVDRDKVGVHGMSEGGRLALNMVVEKNNKVAFVNAVSGPIVSYKDTHLYSIHNYFLERNIDYDVITKAVYVWDSYYDDISKRKISKTTLNSINELIESVPNLSYLPDNSGQLPASPLPEDIYFDLEGKLENIECPILLQYGEDDIIVNSKKSIALIPNKPNFEIKNYLNTDHSMNLKNGDINPNFLMDKLIWMKKILIQN